MFLWSNGPGSDGLSPGSGGLLSPKSYVVTWMCLSNLENLNFYFLSNHSPICIPFSIENHPILPKLGAFLQYFAEHRPTSNFWIWAPSSLMKPTNRYTKFREKAPQKGRHIYKYHVNVRTPGGSVHNRYFNSCPSLVLYITAIKETEANELPTNYWTSLLYFIQMH